MSAYSTNALKHSKNITVAAGGNEPDVVLNKERGRRTAASLGALVGLSRPSSVKNSITDSSA